MSAEPDVRVDVLVFGGGIAGLWLLDALRASGYSAALLEAAELGGGQTVASQGIIHGGAKYTFGFTLDSGVKELRDMPSVWRAALRGAAGPDLRSAVVLSKHTYLWLPRQLGGQALGLFSSLIMRSRVEKLPRGDWPEPLRSSGAPGAVFALDELVLDPASAVAAFLSAHGERIRKIPEADEIEFGVGAASVRVGALTIAAQRIAFAAGAGNEDLMRRAGVESIRCQRRPLHQVMVRGMPQPLYAHCVGRRAVPLATVTSHPLPRDGGYVWYIGGRIAESGVTESEEQLIARARRAVPRLFPGSDISAATWATLRIDRAEGSTGRGRRPGGPVVESRGEYLIAWPTKLALAPRLAERVVASLRQQGVRPGPAALERLAVLPRPSVAQPPWQRVRQWN